MTMWMLHSFDGRLLFASEHRERVIDWMWLHPCAPGTGRQITQWVG